MRRVSTICRYTGSADWGSIRNFISCTLYTHTVQRLRLVCNALLLERLGRYPYEMGMGIKPTRRTLLAGLGASACLSAFQHDRMHLPPVDESGKDPSFREFRDKLVAAIAGKDARQLLAYV